MQHLERRDRDDAHDDADGEHVDSGRRNVLGAADTISEDPGGQGHATTVRRLVTTVNGLGYDEAGSSASRLRTGWGDYPAGSIRGSAEGAGRTAAAGRAVAVALVAPADVAVAAFARSRSAVACDCVYQRCVS